MEQDRWVRGPLRDGDEASAVPLSSRFLPSKSRCLLPKGTKVPRHNRRRCIIPPRTERSPFPSSEEAGVSSAGAPEADVVSVAAGVAAEVDSEDSEVSIR